MQELVDERVIVESANGHRFEGVLKRVDFSQRDVLLSDAREVVAEAEYPVALVTGVDWIVRLETDAESFG